jgi:hypothetical protein
VQINGTGAGIEDFDRIVPEPQKIDRIRNIVLYELPVMVIKINKVLTVRQTNFIAKLDTFSFVIR